VKTSNVECLAAVLISRYVCNLLSLAGVRRLRGLLHEEGRWCSWLTASQLRSVECSELRNVTTGSMTLRHRWTQQGVV
jgi:hypothetical protein